MNNIGDKMIIGNPEDIMSLQISEIFDVYEVSPMETYAGVIEYSPLLNLNWGGWV